jgi:hypothetical protein
MLIVNKSAKQEVHITKISLAADMNMESKS